MNEYSKIAQPIIQDAAFRPNLGMQLPQFEMGSRSGIQSALQPLRGFISNQIQQQIYPASLLLLTAYRLLFLHAHIYYKQLGYN